MKTVVYRSGVESSWDETLTVGELVTTYHSGYHILHRVEPRDDDTPLMHYTRVVKKDGAFVKAGQQERCDATFVRRYTRDQINAAYAAELEAAERKRDNLLKFVASAP